MKRGPIVPARVDFGGEVPRSLDVGDVYHALAGAAEQARHVFLGGNGLPGRWQGWRHFTVLETGFGLGGNFLATWAAWRDDPLRCARLDFVSLESRPLRRDDLQRALASSPWPDLAAALLAAWPPLLPGVHTLHFERGRVRLHLVLGDARDTLPALTCRTDAFYLDGFAPRLEIDLWGRHVLRALGRRAAPGATLSTWCVAREVRRGLEEAGFEVGDAPGLAGRARMTVGRVVSRRPAAARPEGGPPGRPGRPWTGERRVAIVGGGLAGAAVAAALVAEGWACTVLDRADAPAAGASGNPAGLFHGALHRDDGLHARLHRAGALRAARAVAEAVQQGAVPGAVDGLRVRLADPEPPPDCPLDYAQAVADEGRWMHYVQGGWVDPAALVRWWMATPGVTWRGRCEVAALRRSSCGPASRDGERSVDDATAAWDLLDTEGRVVHTAPVVVLALGHGLCGWSGWPGLGTGCQTKGTAEPVAPWHDATLMPVRGQVSWFAMEPSLNWPVSGHGYAVQLPGGRLLFGATSTRHDDHPTVREADHALNLARLHELTGLAPAAGTALEGRVGWRAVTPDRLPLMGAVPRLEGGPAVEQVRFVPREPGLFVLGGYGSRGLTWSVMGAEIVTAWLEGTPAPLEGDLLDAVDPARFAVRAWRRSARSQAMDHRQEG